MYLSGIKAETVGRIVTAPQQSNANNSIVTSFTISVTAGYGKKKHTQFVECSFWGKDSESLMKYPVGHLISVCGAIEAIPYVSKEDNSLKVQYKISQVIHWQSLMSLSESSGANANTSTEQRQPTPQTKQKTTIQKQLLDSADKQTRDALLFVFNKGKYAQKRVVDVLVEDYKYIYDICSNKEYGNIHLKRMLSMAYNFYYEWLRKSRSDDSNRTNSGKKMIAGTRNNYVPHYPENTSDDDLPF